MFCFHRKQKLLSPFFRFLVFYSFVVYRTVSSLFRYYNVKLCIHIEIIRRHKPCEVTTAVLLFWIAFLFSTHINIYFSWFWLPKIQNIKSISTYKLVRHNINLFFYFKYKKELNYCRNQICHFRISLHSRNNKYLFLYYWFYKSLI